MPAELRKLKTEKIDGLVLDLRDNGGGALTDAVGIAGLFIKTGPVVQVRASDGRTQVLADDDPAIEYSGPMVVLVNQFSASASEILAGALQDYGRALVMGGAHTHGKGTVQAIIDLDRTIPFRNMEQYKPLGALKMTTQKFYRISGESTQYRGVVPDIVLPDRLEYLKTGEKFLDYSLPWDKIAPTRFSHWTGLDNTDLSLIESRSRQRVAASEKFHEITTEADLAKSQDRTDPADPGHRGNAPGAGRSQKTGGKYRPDPVTAPCRGRTVISRASASAKRKNSSPGRRGCRKTPIPARRSPSWRISSPVSLPCTRPTSRRPSARP